MKWLYFLLLVFVLYDFVLASDLSAVGGYVINKSVVSYRNDFGEIKAYPHTSNDFSKHIIFYNVTNFKNASLLDTALLFDDYILDYDVFVWENINHPRWVDDYRLVQFNFTCVSKDFGYSLLTNFAYCNDLYYFDNISYNFSHSFIGIDTKLKSFWWYENVSVGGHFEDDYYYDWVTVKKDIVPVIDGGYIYYWLNGLSQSKNVEKNYKIVFISNINSKGKWQILSKNNGVGLGDSIIANDYVLLDPWWNASWLNRKSFNISSYYNLVNFPVFINVSKESAMQSDFDDLRFVNGACNNVSGGELSYEIENFTSDYAIVWFKANLSVGINNFCMYYNNPVVGSGEDVGGVWDDYFVGVWHLGDIGSVRVDSALGDNGTYVGSAGHVARARIDGGDGFDGNNDYISVNDVNSLDLTNNFTIEVWINNSALLGGNYNFIVSKHVSSADTGYMFVTALNGLGFAFGDGGGGWPYCWVTTSNTMSNDLWHHAVVVRNGTMLTFYMDTVGEVEVCGGNNIAVNTQNFWIGDDVNSPASQAMGGMLDEVRVSNVARSFNYINMSYLIVVNQSSIVRFGGEENVTGTQCTTITDNVTLIQNVSSTGSCMVFGADNVVLDCANHSIVYGTGGLNNKYGVSDNGYDYVVVKNCVIVEGNFSTDSCFGVYATNNVYNFSILNNNISTGGLYSSNIKFTSGVYNSSVFNNVLFSVGNLSSGLTFDSNVMYNNVSYNVINNPNTAIGLSGNVFGGSPVKNNFFLSNVILNKSSVNVGVYFDCYDNVFLNMSINKSRIIVGSALQNLTIGYFMRVNVSNDSGGVGGVVVNVSDVFGKVVFFGNTSAGLTDQFVVTDLFMNNTGNISFNPYFVVIKKNNFWNSGKVVVENSLVYNIGLFCWYFDVFNWLYFIPNGCIMFINTLVGF